MEKGSIFESFPIKCFSIFCSAIISYIKQAILLKTEEVKQYIK